MKFNKYTKPYSESWKIYVREITNSTNAVWRIRNRYEHKLTGFTPEYKLSVCWTVFEHAVKNKNKMMYARLGQFQTPWPITRSKKITKWYSSADRLFVWNFHDEFQIRHNNRISLNYISNAKFVWFSDSVILNCFSLRINPRIRVLSFISLRSNILE